jgi:RimJ/RimL family protein N-acetyltransferase
MSHLVLQTKDLDLVLQTTGEVLAQIEAMSAADRAEVSPDWLDRVRSSTAADPWTHGFAVINRESAAMIGSCGFKGPPGPDGVIEIAYGIDPDHQGRGYATEAARALVAYALGSKRVHLVRAHTRQGPNASTRVLTKCGFAFVGEVVDPEDGLVWRWEFQDVAGHAAGD